MRCSSALLVLTVLCACGDRQQTADGNGAEAVTPANSVIAPISTDSQTPKRPEQRPSPTTPKPLVSRGTSAKAQPSTDKLVHYRAIGTEPFWAVTVHGETAVLERPDHPPLRFPVRSDSGDTTIRYYGDGFTMTATKGPCSDGMSDDIWSDRVQIAFGDGVFKGCGGIREDMREHQR